MSVPAFESLPEALQTVRTRPLFVMRLAVRPMVVIGQTPGGLRRVGVVTGGAFEGERLSGEIMDGGADWQTVRTDGAVALDVRITLKTADGAVIGMTYQGLRHGPADILARIDAGEVLDPATHYFRIQAAFTAAAPQHDCLNRVLAIGVGHRRSDGPVYSLFEVV